VRRWRTHPHPCTITAMDTADTDIEICTDVDIALDADVERG